MERIDRDNYYLDIALAVSRRSTCLRRRYGAVIVKKDEIIATGYNGSPRGELNCCDTGGCKRMDMPHNTGDYSQCFSVHAEQNALISASRKDMIGATLYLAGEELIVKEGEEYVWKLKEIEQATPCPMCMRMIKNAGIVMVVNRREGKAV